MMLTWLFLGALLLVATANAGSNADTLTLFDPELFERSADAPNAARSLEEEEDSVLNKKASLSAYGRRRS
ncbi:hypothetical protein V1264_008393 [Littorina saxatilis]|uniref:Uncharacterized protein n=1 Tax=Littorina saxatilis TaxID=31220 RepID=A0AAN9ATF5_9CAEN